jgi:asparagine synthase (glutamine-hydrolysing)
MTAFAAILADRADPAGVQRTAAILARVGHASPIVCTPPGCTLIQASRSPLPPCTPDGVLLAGPIMLEGRVDLARRLGLGDAAAAGEVVRAAYERWGINCPDRLSGEYAFALWDPAARTLLSARDGLGIRMLYAAEAPGLLIVTNVLGAAAAYTEALRDLDPIAAREFLLGDGDPYRTIYQRISVVPEGHALAVRDGVPQALRRHWSLPEPEVRWRDAGDVIAGYREVLERAVADRIGSGPAAILQSGGIDSGTVVAAAVTARGGPAGLHGFVSEYRRFAAIDEVPCAALTCRALKIPLTVVPGDAAEPLDADWHGPLTPEPYDEPSLTDWRTLIQAAAAHAPVTLNGEDGDALFAPPVRAQLLANGGVLTTLRGAVVHAATSRTIPAIGLRDPPRPPGAEIITWLGPGSQPASGDGPRRVCGFVPTPPPPHPTRPRTGRRLSAQNLRYFAATLAPEATGAATDITLPLMDRRVIEWVFAAPPIPWCQQKRLARVAYRHLLPDAICRRPKQAVDGFFERAVASWRPRAAGEARVPRALASFVDEREWRRVIEHGRADAVVAAWRVLTLGAWLARTGATL